MNKKTKLLIIVLCAALLLTVLLYFLLSADKMHKNDDFLLGNTPSNLYNGGYFCEFDGKVYFANAHDNDSLYVMNADETACKKLLNTSVLSINTDGHRIYYSQSGKSSGQGLGFVRKTAGLFSCDLHGNNSICYTQNPVASVTLYGNNLYYQNYIKKKGTSLYRIGTNRKDNIEISKDMINPSCILNGYIYCSGIGDNNYINAFDITNFTLQAFRAVNAYMPIYHSDGYIYYIDPDNHYSLNRYDPVNDEYEVLADGRIDFYNLWGDIIYYQVSYGSSPALHRVSTDGTGDIILVNGIYKDLQTTTQYVYFRSYEDESLVFHASHYGSSEPEQFIP